MRLAALGTLALLLSAIVVDDSVLAAKKKAKKQSPLQHALNNKPAALKELSAARLELTRASLEVQRLLREAASVREDDPASDLFSLRQARESEKEAETYLNSLMERLRQRLRENHDTYGQTWKALRELRWKQDDLRKQDSADPAERLKLVKQIDEHEQALAEIVEEAVSENQAIQTARAAHDDAVRVVEAELALINSRRNEATENVAVKEASQRVAEARKLVIEKEKAVAQINAVIDANRPRPTISVGGTPDKKKNNKKKNKR